VASIATAVRAHVAANAGVAALVGTRIYPDALPQGYNAKTIGPALVYVKFPAIRGRLINGLDGIARARIEFTAYASTRATADAVDRAVLMSGLIGFTGDMGGIEIESLNVEGDGQSLDESPTDGTQSHRYLTVSDYIVTYQEST
jgi:hypothetical protein